MNYNNDNLGDFFDDEVFGFLDETEDADIVTKSFGDRLKAMKGILYAEILFQAYEDFKESLNENDFVINSPQMNKFINLVKFFSKKAQTNNIHINPIDFNVKERCLELSMSCIIFDLVTEEIQEFCSILNGASCISIDSNSDEEICVAIVIPDVFIHKDEVE